MNDLLAIAKQMIQDGRTRAEVYAFLDQQAVNRPELGLAVESVKTFLAPIFSQGGVDSQFQKAIDEVMALLKNKYGPVSDAPEIGLA